MSEDGLDTQLVDALPGGPSRVAEAVDAHAVLDQGTVCRAGLHLLEHDCTVAM